MAPRNGLAEFLGFDPEVEAPASRFPEPIPKREPDQIDDADLALAVRANPRGALVIALCAIFDQAVEAARRDPRRVLPTMPTGPLGVVRAAALGALKECAHRHRDQVAGWIIGKRDDPQI